MGPEASLAQSLPSFPKLLALTALAVEVYPKGICYMHCINWRIAGIQVIKKIVNAPQDRIVVHDAFFFPVPFSKVLNPSCHLLIVSVCTILVLDSTQFCGLHCNSILVLLWAWPRARWCQKLKEEGLSGCWACFAKWGQTFEGSGFGRNSGLGNLSQAPQFWTLP